MREVWARLSKWFVGWWRMEPHFTVGPPHDPYLHWWYLIPRNPYLNCYLHQFVRSDDPRARHDHPWKSVSVLLLGEYVEDAELGRTHYKALSFVRRATLHAHRVILPEGRPAWTMFVTGPVEREWGFWCPSGWRHWKEFTDFALTGKSGEVGKGCE